MFAKSVTRVFLALSLLGGPLLLTEVGVERLLPMDAWATIGIGAVTGCTLTETAGKSRQNG